MGIQLFCWENRRKVIEMAKSFNVSSAVMLNARKDVIGEASGIAFRLLFRDFLYRGADNTLVLRGTHGDMVSLSLGHDGNGLDVHLSDAAVHSATQAG